MKALTIHNHQAGAPDFCAGIEGEIAIAPMVCDSPGCGCDLSHAGLNSHAASTTLMVREVNLDLEELVAACVGFLEAAGWANLLGGPGEVRDAARDMVSDSVDAAADYAPGTVLRPRFDREHEEWHYTEVT